MRDFDEIQFSSDNSSLKLWKEGAGTITVPGRGANDFQKDKATIAHGYNSDQLIVEVGFKNQFTGETAYHPLFASGGTYFVAWLDNNNLYIEAGDSTGGAPQPDPMPFYYAYRLLIP